MVWRDVTVYGLCSTEDGKIRYVGQTTQSLKKRLDSHCHPSPSGAHTYVARWIRKVRSKGYKVKIFVIENHCIWGETEKRLIALYRKMGAKLVNLTDGGEGVVGWHHSEESKKKLSEQHKGRKHSAEHIANMRLAKLGKHLSDETKQKISEKLRGRIPKNIQMLRQSNTGKHRSEETKRKLSFALIGRMVTSKEQLMRNLGRCNGLAS